VDVTSTPPTETSRNVYAFGATSFLNDTASEMAYWVLPAFLVSLGAGPDKLGLIEGIAESVASFAKLFSGILTDRLDRRKPVVVTGYVVANAAKPLLALVVSWWQVLLIRFADRLAKGVRGAPRDVMLTESVPKERVGAAFGLLQSMDSAGAIAGPLLALWILRSGTVRDVFSLALVPGALSVIVALLFIREKRGTRNRQAPANTASESGGARLPRQFYYRLAVLTLFSIGNSSDAFLVLRAQSAGIAPAYAPLLGLVFNITYTALSWPAGRLSDKLRRESIAAVGYLVFAGVYFAFALAPSQTALWTAMAFYGLFYALTGPVLRALVADTVSPDIRGRAFGVYYFATSIATLVASVVTGELWKWIGAAVPFYLSSGLAVIAAMLLLLPYGSRRA
jgi:MFS family permease